MATVGMRKGEKYEVLIVKDELVLGSIEHAVISDAEVKTSVFVEDGEGLVSIYEALSAAASAVNFHLHSNKLQQLLEERINELEAAREGAEGEPPCPDDVTDIPF